MKDNPRGGKQVSTSPTNSPRYKTSQRKMEKFDSAYLAYLCVWFQNITVKHFIPIYVGLKLITILWINIQKGLLSSSLLFSCRAKRLNRGASVPPQQGVKIPV